MFHQKLEKQLFGEIIQLESADEKDQPLSAKTTPNKPKSVKKVGDDSTNQTTTKKKNKAQLLFQKLKKQAKAGTQLGA